MIVRLNRPVLLEKSGRTRNGINPKVGLRAFHGRDRGMKRQRHAPQRVLGTRPG